MPHGMEEEEDEGKKSLHLIEESLKGGEGPPFRMNASFIAFLSFNYPAKLLTCMILSHAYVPFAGRAA